MKKTILPIILFFLLSLCNLNAQVVISEVFFDSPLNEKMRPKIGVDMEGIHHNGEYVELYNNSATSVDLSGYELGVLLYGYTNFKIPKGTICKSKESIVIAFRHPNSAGFKLNEIFPTLSALDELKVLYHSSFVLGNNGNLVLLFNPSGNVVSKLYYDRLERWNSVHHPLVSVHNKNMITPSLAEQTYTDLADPFKVKGITQPDQTLAEMLPFKSQKVEVQGETVGEIKSDLSVSPNGAAIVEIPLGFPSGMNGMEPKLSVAYSSQSGSGPLGRGTSLSGLSSISRTNQNLFYENPITKIKFSKEGPYSLDGQRLLSDKPGRYITQIHSLTQIEEVGESGNGPLYFRVTSPQGIVAEYGSEESARVYATDRQNILSWMISKATDPNGNTITYTYTSDPEKGTYLKEIIYGETGSNRINFNYIDNSYHPSVSFIDGSFFHSNLLLSDIEVSAGASKHTKYQFKYNDDQLTKVIENGTNGEQLSLNWVWNTYSEKKNTELVIDAAKQDNGYFTTGDINGDGKVDLVRFYTHKNENYLELYFKENDKYVCRSTFRLQDNNSGKSKRHTYQLYNCMDFNNDGKEEIIVIYKYIDENRTNCYVNIFEYTDTKGIVELPNGTMYSYTDLGDEQKLTVLNYNNDKQKTPDLACVGKNGKVAILTDLKNDHPLEITLPYDEVTEAIAMDYNGDGISELLIRSDYDWRLVDLKSPGQYIDLTSEPDIHCASVTDLNGDGLDDIIFANKAGDLLIYTNKGRASFDIKRIQTDPNGEIKKAYKNQDTFWIDDMELVRSDINNDGHPEIAVQLHIKGEYLENVYLLKLKLTKLVKMNVRPGGQYEITYTDLPDNWDRNMMSADFNGDGVEEYAEATYGKRVTIEFMDVANRQLLSSIQSNGITRAQFEYGFASDKELHHCPDNNGGKSVTVKNLNVPIPLVSYLNQPDGSDNFLKTRYRYRNGKFHTEGLGFIGFEQMTQTTRTGGNVRERQMTTQYHDINYLPIQFEISSWLNGKITENQTIINECNFSDSDKTVILKKKSESVTSELDGSSRVTEYTYDSHGRITSEKTTGDDHSYIRTEYSDYNTFGQAGKIIKSKRHFQDQKEFTETTTNTYDSKSNLTRTVSFDGSSAPVTTTYTINDKGMISGKQASAPNVETVKESYEYKTVNNRKVIVKQNAFSRTTSYFNILTGNLEEESVELTGMSAQTTRYTYDGLGRATGSTLPNGIKTEKKLSWCTEENKYYYKTIETKTGENPVTRWFDILGREVYSASRQGDVLVENASIIDEDGNKTGEFTKHPQKITWTNYFYYPDGRMESQVTRTGKSVKFSYKGRQVTTDENGKTSIRTLDSWGNTLTLTDPENNTITHRYNSNSQPVSTTVGAHTVAMTYDDKGNQLKLVDPDIGEITYTYDAYGRIKTYRAPKGSYSLTYDAYGRMKQKAYASKVVDYTYYDSGNGITLLKSAQASNGTSDAYTYNEYGQVLTHTQKTDGRTFSYSYEYDGWGRLTRQTSPNGYTQRYKYSDTDSRLMMIVGPNGRILWKYVADIPGIRQTYNLGNQVTCQTVYSEDETMQTIQYIKNASLLLGYNHRLDPLLGNVTSRSETYRSKTRTERFTYDTMDRLTDIEGDSDMSLSFDNNGNITRKTGVGVYRYESDKPHAVSDIDLPSEELTAKAAQQITYTEFNKIGTIKEGIYEMRFTYGPDDERVKSELYQSGKLFRTVYYGNGFDLKIDRNGKVTEHSYLGGDGSFGVAIRDASTGTENTYYFHCDLLGSIVAITNFLGNIVEKRSYDAWGRQRNPLDWNDYENIPTMTVTQLGFTFQEEMPEFGLINLNGRLYDPMLGRMLSPDPFIQDPENSQNYNRYSYAWNNPMKYTDPNGNFILGFFLPGIGSVVDAMLWSGLSYSIQAKDNWNAGDFFSAMFTGALFSSISMGFSTAIGDFLGHEIGSIGKEALRAGLHGAVGGLLSVASGSNFLDGLASGAISSLAGSGMQAMKISDPFLLGLGGAVSGGATAALTGGNWGMAAFQGFMVGMFNHGGKDLDDWMTVDKDGKRKIVNVELQDVVVEGQKGPIGLFNHLNNPDVYNLGGTFTELIKIISESYEYNKLKNFSKTTGIGISIISFVNAQIQFYYYKNTPFNQYLLDSTLSLISFIPKYNIASASISTTGNAYYSGFKHFVKFVNNLESRLKYKMSHPNLFMFNPTFP